MFSQSKMGSVAVALTPDFQGVFEKYPAVLPRMIKGPSATSEPLGPRAARVAYRDMYGPYYYLLGALEGIALFFGQRLVTEVDARDDGRIAFDLSW